VRFWIGNRNARCNSRGCEACEAGVGLVHCATLRSCDCSTSPSVDKYNSLLIHAKRFRISCAAFPVGSSSVTPSPPLSPDDRLRPSKDSGVQMAMPSFSIRAIACSVSANRDSTELSHDCGGFLASCDKINRGGQILDVLPVVRPRNQHDVGNRNCRRNNGFHKGRSIQQNQFRAPSLGSSHSLRQARIDR